MKQRIKVRSYLSRRGIHINDFILLLLLFLLLFFLRGSLLHPQDLLQFKTEISLGYIAKQAGNNIYVIDSGHSRLFCFDKDGNEIFEVTNPSDNGYSSYYIDDIAVTGDGVYVSASEWDGMQIAREVIFFLDQSGNYQKTCVERDYSSGFINKHRFYGLSGIEGRLIFAECLENTILVHRVNPDTLVEQTEAIAYDDAFNAVSDIVFDDNQHPVIINKNGKIQRCRSLAVPELLYTTEWTGEDERVPFRITLYNGDVYFTDIRGSEVVRADTAGKTGEVCYTGTDSLTVTFTPEGQMLLTEYDGVRRTGENEAVFLQFSRPAGQIREQILSLAALILLAVITILLLIRLITHVITHKYTLTQGVAFSIVLSVIIVTGIISSMLLHSFRTSYREKIKEQLESSAYVVASQISEQEMDSIRTTADFESEAYKSICTLMENTLPVEQPFYSQIYCNILRLDKESGHGYAIAYLDKSIGVYYPLDEYETESVMEVYETDASVWDDASTDVSGSYLAVKVPVNGNAGEVVGAVSVGVDNSVINKVLNEMQKKVLLSVIVIAMLLWVVAAEAMSYVLGRESRSKAARDKGQKPFPAQMIRLLVFLVFSAYNLSSTFLPVYVLRNSELFTGELRNLAASLPLTINIFTMGAMSLFCAGLVRKAGMKRIMIYGSLFALSGNLLLLLIPNYYAVFIGLFLDGIGEGLIMNALYVFLTYIKNEEDRRTGFTIYNAAYLSGVNFGMLSGSLLAVAFGQRPVFLVSVLTWGLLLILGLYLVRALEDTLSVSRMEAEPEEDSTVSISSLRFISNKAILSFILLIQNPYIIFNSFVFYLVPLFCSDQGYDETIVSILIMLYSQIAVLSGDYLTEHLSSLFGSRSMYVAMLLNIAAVIIFALTGTMNGLVVALVILGFSAAFGKPVQQSYFLDTKPAIRYGEDRAIGVYNFTENIGESLGPIVFSRLLGASLRGYSSFLALVAGCCGLHFVMNRGGNKT